MTTGHAPAQRLEIPKHFGRRPDTRFRSASGLQDVSHTEAARLQHHSAVAVLDELARRSLSLAWLAGELGENTDHLRRKLYGQAVASLRDLCAWAYVLELDTPVPPAFVQRLAGAAL
jgi:hypothetical protein